MHQGWLHSKYILVRIKLKVARLTYISVQALFLSPKNSIDGALNVLEKTDCNIWVQPRELPRLPQVDEFLRHRPLKILDIPETDDLLDAETTEPYPYTKTWEEAAQDPFCVLHSSGSTGLPKPIPWSHALIGTMDAVRSLPPTEGDNGMAPWASGWNEGDRLYSSFPMSHVSLSASIILKSCQLTTIPLIGRWCYHGYSHPLTLCHALHPRARGSHT